MTYQELYAGALAMLGEDAANPGNGDLAARAPLLLSSLMRALTPDARLFGAVLTVPSLVSLTDECALPDALRPTAESLLAAFLILDEQPELAVRLLSRADAFRRKAMDEATEISSIREVY